MFAQRVYEKCHISYFFPQKRKENVFVRARASVHVLITEPFLLFSGGKSEHKLLCNRCSRKGGVRVGEWVKSVGVPPVAHEGVERSQRSLPKPTQHSSADRRTWPWSPDDRPPTSPPANVTLLLFDLKTSYLGFQSCVLYGPWSPRALSSIHLLKQISVMF